MPTKKEKIVVGAPSHPSPGDLVLFCVHGRADLHMAHFFYLPVDGHDDGWYFTRPDGSRRGPARWIVMCDACFKRHARHPLNCPFNADMNWPSDLRVEIDQAARRPHRES
jgi:hypothetical protein